MLPRKWRGNEIIAGAHTVMTFILFEWQDKI